MRAHALKKIMAMSRWGSEAFRQSCTAVGREALAMLKQATLLHRDVLSSPLRLPTEGQKADLVVLLHGLFATAGVLRPMRERIELEAEALTVSFTYPPGTSVVELAHRIAALVRDVPGEPRIHLVGHSLGGLAVRWYVQELPYDPRVVQTICLASPFAGSRHARLMPGPAGRDLLPGSPVLRRIQERASEIDLPHLSLAAANDLMVEPGAWLECGDRRIFAALGHNGLLYAPEVISEVVQRIQSVIGEESELAPESPEIEREAERFSRERLAGGWAQEQRWSERDDIERQLSERPARVSSGS